MTPFDYIRPKSLQEALSILSENGDDAQIIAGGHTLLPLLKMRMASVGTLIDIQDLDELKAIEISDHEITIGALTRHVDLQKSNPIFQDWPIIREAAGQIADIQVRNRGTIGGSISAADPSADWPAIVLLLQGRMTLQSAESKRSVSAEDYFIGMMETACQPNEILTHIHIPRNLSGAKANYQKFRHPASGYAVASAAVSVTLSEGMIKNTRIAISGTSDTVYLALKSAELLRGKPPSDAAFRQAAKAVTEGRSILTDQFADKNYRIQLASTMCQRALHACCTAS